MKLPITADTVRAIHDEILRAEPGLHGDLGADRLEGALARVDNRIAYADLDDVFGIAAMYAVAIARGHTFNDANKRTALVVALMYLSAQGVDIPRTDQLEDIMVGVAQGIIGESDLADVLYQMGGE
jgi:death-on-curing protein